MPKQIVTSATAPTTGFANKAAASPHRLRGHVQLTVERPPSMKRLTPLM